MLQVILSGVSQGCIYGLVALGFVLIYKATETVSFAQGELMMVGGFTALVMTQFIGLPFWLAVLVCLAAVGLVGYVLERVVIRPVLGQTALAVVLLTIGLGYVARGLVAMLPVIGTETHTLAVPYAGKTIILAGLIISYDHLVVIGSTLVICLLLYLNFQFTKYEIEPQIQQQPDQ